MEKRKNGFTLIELLSVIVVLATIAAIIVPNVVTIMKRSERDSFENSAYGILTAAKEYYQEKAGEEDFSGKTFDFTESVDLNFDGKKPTGGTVTINREGNVEIYVTDGTYCAVKEMASTQVSVFELSEIGSCGGEMKEPTFNTFKVVDDSVGADSFSVIGTCSDEVGISKYEYLIYEEGQKKEEAAWLSSKNGIYDFDNLKSNTTYVVEMRCQNNNGIKTYAPENLTVTTGDIEVTCNVTPSANGWAPEKTIHIQYTNKANYERQYSVDNGETWKNVTEYQTELKFTQPGSVIARIVDGTRKVSVMCTANKVDSTSPSAEGSIIETSGIDKTITVGAYCSDAESGIVKYEYAISETQVPSADFDKIEKIYTSTSNAYKFRDLTEEGKYYIYVRCTNGAGLTETSDPLEADVTDRDRVKCVIDKSGYTNSGKTVTITYPKNYKNTYRVNSSDGSRVASIGDQNLDNNVEYETDKLSVDILVKAPADVFGKIESAEGNTQSTLCDVNGIDMIAPTLSVESKPDEGEWHNENKEIILTKNDEGGSGVKAYYISQKDVAPKSTSTCKEQDQNDEWVCDNAQTLTIKRGLENVPTKGPETYYVWVMDGAGNISDKKTIVIDKIETTKPTCSLKIVEGTSGKNGWYVSDVKVEITTLDEKGKNEYESSGVGSFGIYSNLTGVEPAAQYTSSSKILTITEDGTNYVYGFVKDKAGNINECGVLVVKKDATEPSCTLTGQVIEQDEAGTIVGSYASGSWTNYFVKTRVNAKDNISKVKSVEFLTTGAVGTNTALHDDENAEEKNEYLTITKEGISNVTAKVTDYAGNVKTCTNIEIKADYTKPTCDIKVAKGTMGKNDWYISDVEFSWDYKKDELSGVNLYGIGLKETLDNNNTYTLNLNSEESGTAVYGYVKDTAGNLNTCSKTVKKDSSEPSLTAKSALVSYTSSDANKDIISFGFDLTYGKSGGNYVCTYDGKEVTKISELGTHHRVSVTCKATSGSGLEKTATTVFRYYYTAKTNYYCDSGWSLSGSTCSKGNSGSNCSHCGEGKNYSTACNSCSWATGTYQCNCITVNLPVKCDSYSCDCSDYTYACGTTSYSCNCQTVPKYCTSSYSGHQMVCGTTQTCSTCYKTKYCTQQICNTCYKYCDNYVTQCETCTSYDSGTNCSKCGSYEYVSSTYCKSCSWTDTKSAKYYYSCPKGGNLTGSACYF